MAGKKHSDIFTIGFNTDIPRHQMTVEALNALGRKKADFISRLFEAAARHPELLEEVGIVAARHPELLKGIKKAGEVPMPSTPLSIPDESQQRISLVHNEQSRQANIEEKEAASQDTVLTSEPFNVPESRKGEQEDLSKKGESVASEEVDGEIPEELKDSLLANLRYFDDMEDDDDED